MVQLGIISLKELLEDFYISEIVKEKRDIELEDIDYISSNEILLKGKQLTKNERKAIFLVAEERLKRYLNTFKCNQNKDVESYLHENSIRMQKENIARTYLIVNLENDDIVAYFTIAIKPMKIREHHKVSSSKKKDLKLLQEDRYDDELFFSFLIGQIGRNDIYDKNTIRLEGILDYVFAYINEVKTLIGGRIVLIEVDGDKEQNKRLVDRYEEVGFKIFSELDEFTQLMIFSKEY